MGEVIEVEHPETEPVVHLTDLGSSVRRITGSHGGNVEVIRAAHEYDTSRLLAAFCEHFDEFQDARIVQWKNCEKEARELQRGCKHHSKQMERKLGFPTYFNTSLATENDLHDARLVAGLQAYVVEEQKAWNIRSPYIM